MKNWQTILLSFLFATTVYAVDATDLPNKNDPVAKDRTQTYHVYDDISLISKLNFEWGKPRIIIKTVTPELTSDANDSENIIYFNQAVAEIVKQETGKYRQAVASYAPKRKNLGKMKLNNNLYIDYNTAAVISGDSHIMSIRFSIQGNIVGMAHPYHYHRVLNFNLDTNEAFELGDLFYPNAQYLERISALASRQLARRGQNSNMIGNGTQAIAENFQNWNIKPHGLVITFEENRVAPQVYGAQAIVIPYAALKDMIAPDSPLAACIKHDSRCVKNVLLTGGFIDEAINTHHRRLDPIFS